MPDVSKHCLICSEEYDTTKRKPLALPCGHVFCDFCLQTMEDAGRHSKNCPECRVSWTNSLRSTLPTIYCLIDNNSCSKQEQMAMELAKMIMKYGATAIKSGVQTFDSFMEKGLSNAGKLFNEDPDEEKEIYVRDLRGTTTTLQLCLTSTVESLRLQLQQYLGIPPDQQLLLHNGRPLENGRILSDYNVKNYSTIHAVCRQLGG